MEQLESQQAGGGMALADPAAAVPRTRFCFKGVRLGTHILRGLALAVVYPLLGANAQRSILCRWSQTVLEILDVRLDVRGAPPELREGGVLLVANHVSWLDVFALNAVRPSSFVAKSEVAQWPVIGTLCKRARTIFIARGNRSDAARASQLMAARIADGEWVAVFPEGTSTDGADVALFHAALFQSAIESACPVVPVAIRYRDRDGHPDRTAAFVGDMTFFQSLANILASEALTVSLTFLNPLDCAGKSRRALAAEAHHAVAGAVRAHGMAPGQAITCEDA